MSRSTSREQSAGLLLFRAFVGTRRGRQFLGQVIGDGFSPKSVVLDETARKQGVDAHSYEFNILFARQSIGQFSFRDERTDRCGDRSLG